MSRVELKRRAARAALDLVEPGMRLGLGTGSTAEQFVDLLGERVRDGLDLVCVPTSEATKAQAERLGIRLATLDEQPELDLVVDGADEIDPSLSLIKGGGGALLREKIVATAAARMVVIADSEKQVACLGAFALPIEVVAFGLERTRLWIRQSGCAGEIVLRCGADGHAFVTDGGHFILDAAYGSIGEPAALARRLSEIPGIVEHGLFIGLADLAYIGTPDGVLEMRRP